MAVMRVGETGVSAAISTSKLETRAMIDWLRGEWVDYPLKTKPDTQTGRNLVKISNGEGNSKPLYFYKKHFTGDRRYVVFSSDRSGSWQVYVCDLKEERVARVSDCAGDPGYPSVDPLRPLVYFAEGVNIHRVDLETMEDDIVYAHPHSDLNMFRLMDVSADGQYVGFVEIDRFQGDRKAPNEFLARYEARPRTRLRIMTADGSKVWTAHEEDRYLYHLQFCPTDPTTLLFCHEGPVQAVDQRMWTVKADGSGMRPLRVHDHPGVTIVHESWLAGGREVVYMYRCPAREEAPTVRKIDVASGEERIVTAFPFHDLISDSSGRFLTGDDADVLYLYDMATEKRTALVAHGQSIGMENQPFHAHPCFSPDGKYISFCMKDEGANDVALVDIEDLTR